MVIHSPHLSLEFDKVWWILLGRLIIRNLHRTSSTSIILVLPSNMIVTSKFARQKNVQLTSMLLTYFLILNI